MRKRLLILIALAISLACNMPVAQGRNPIDRMATIDSLAITPVESDGTRPLLLSFGYTIPTVRTTFECSYTGPSGVETTIGGHNTGYDIRRDSEQPITDQVSMTFSVSAPGKYIAHCWDTVGPASETTSFTINTPNLTVQGSEQVPQAGQEGPVVQKITSPGTLTYYYYPVKYGDHYEPKTLVTCKTEMQITLTIWQNGTARLDAAGSYYTLYTCTADVLDKFEFFDLGSAEPYGAEYTVQLASLRRTGTVGTSGGMISGTITQTLPDGNTQFTLEIGKK